MSDNYDSVVSCSKSCEESENKQFSHASVLLIDDGLVEIVLIKDIEDLMPRDANDFDFQKKYKFWFNNDEFTYVNVLRLGKKTMFSGKNHQSSEEAKKVPPVEARGENDTHIDLDPDDPCYKKLNDNKKKKERKKKVRTVGEDPRFQQMNQTLRCYVSYTDYFRCQKILGEGHEACDWFKDVYNTFCPLKWIEEWDLAREEGRMPYHKGEQGKFPGYKYG